MDNKLIVNSQATERDDEGHIYYQGILFTGIEEWHYDTGEIGTTTSYKDGLPDGPMYGWYRNGIKSGEKFYVEGRIAGMVRKWAENGNLKLEEEIYNGKALWTKEWDEDGNLVTDYRSNENR